MDLLHPILWDDCEALVKAWPNSNMTILPGGTGYVVYDFTMSSGVLRQSTTEYDQATNTILRLTRVFYTGFSDCLAVTEERVTQTTQTTVKTIYTLDDPVRATKCLSWTVNPPADQATILSRTSSLYTKLTTVKENGVVTSKIKEYWFPGMPVQSKVLVPRTPEQLAVDKGMYATDEED
jgi:hypothetical protein